MYADDHLVKCLDTSDLARERMEAISELCSGGCPPTLPIARLCPQGRISRIVYSNTRTRTSAQLSDA
jgi:hypothetical protein